MYACMHLCLYIYLHTCACVFMGRGRSKCVNSEFIVETASICVCLSTYVKGCICLCILW